MKWFTRSIDFKVESNEQFWNYGREGYSFAGLSIKIQSQDYCHHHHRHINHPLAHLWPAIFLINPIHSGRQCWPSLAVPLTIFLFAPSQRPHPSSSKAFCQSVLCLWFARSSQQPCCLLLFSQTLSFLESSLVQEITPCELSPNKSLYYFSQRSKISR